MKPARIALFASLLGAYGAVFAASGEFTFVTGEVNLVKAGGQRVAAARGLAVDRGDRVVTGANGMAQLTMVDNARLSLRPNSDFRIEQYVTSPDGEDGVVLSLARGTLRAFTGLLRSASRDKFKMKTAVATVGIRGSGNILHACKAQECDPSIRDKNSPPGLDIAVNHTIEGSHSITNEGGGPPGLPPQQGGPTTIVTGPGQTVLVQGNNPPRNIPTPQFIADTASNPTGAPKGPASGQGAAAGTGRNFAPGDVQLIPLALHTPGLVGNNGLGFVTIDVAQGLPFDSADLQDIVIAADGTTLFGQATRPDLQFEAGNTSQLRGYHAYPAGLVPIDPSMSGGTLSDTHSVSVGGASIVMGRWQGASLGAFGASGPVAGNVHWIYAPAGFPGYLSEVLTGTAVYTLAANTSPTNQSNTAGSLGTATLNVNFTNRTLGLTLAVTMPGAGANPGGAWNLSADSVPFGLNGFFASTGDRLVITNGSASSASNGNLFGSVEGSFVGSRLQGAILGYGFVDQTHTNPANHNIISGVAAFIGPAQDGNAPYREGRVSDPSGSIGLGFTRSYATTNRPDEVSEGANGAVTSFAAPYVGLGGHARYAQGSAQVVQSGTDPSSGMVWGRWSGGTATVTGANGQTQSVNLGAQSLHYIFAGTQQGPVSLPLTGSASYDVIGSTSPTNGTGQVGTLGSATLDVNFTNRTAASTVNVSIAGQSWTGNAPNMPIFRNQYFSASTGIPGVMNLSPLTITCTPSCGAGAVGSFDGFFTGRTGQHAGMIYNLGGVQGALAFGRRGN